MINIKKFGMLEILVLLSAIYVLSTLIWTATTRSEVEEKANQVKLNHKTIVNFIDQALTNPDNKNLITNIKFEVNELMSKLPLFKP